jgi:hypothetical protein
MRRYKISTMLYLKDKDVLGQIVGYACPVNGYESYQVYWFRSGQITKEYESSLIVPREDYLLLSYRASMKSMKEAKNK